MPLALDGLKVLDLAHLLPGMYCTMFLGDLGADVLRVERPAQEESSSESGQLKTVMDSSYEAFNRNKRSITLNMRSEEARQIIYKLVRNTDVVVEGFRPGVTQRLGIDYETLKEINPRLIYCSMSGYGQDGPYCKLPGHDLNYISVGGVQDMIGQRDGPHVIPMNFIADFAGAALHAVISILAAIIAREQTTRGQYIDISYLDTVLSLMTSFAYDYFDNGTIYRRGETFFSGASPCCGVYQCKDDKYCSVACVEPWFWENICRALEREDFIPYQFDEGAKKDEIAKYLQEVFRTRTRDEWFNFLFDKNIPISKLYSIDEVFSDPQVIHRQMLVEVAHPVKGMVKHVASAIKLSDTPGTIRSGAPVPGQDTVSVLTELGYTKEKIENFKKEGAVYY